MQASHGFGAPENESAKQFSIRPPVKANSGPCGSVQVSPSCGCMPTLKTLARIEPRDPLSRRDPTQHDERSRGALGDQRRRRSPDCSTRERKSPPGKHRTVAGPRHVHQSSSDGMYVSVQKINFAASCMLNGSPAPMPGALLALRVLLNTPKLVELDSVAPRLAQLIQLSRLKISARS
jgi:hypothetical protein